MLHCTENFPAVILRLFLTYGPGQDAGRFIPQIICSCRNNDTFPVSAGEQLRDFCYIDDTVSAIFHALEKQEVNGEVLNVASGEPVKIRDMIEKVCALTGSGKPQYGKVSYRPGENMALYANISKGKKILQWEPRTNIDIGLQKTINYYNNT